MSLLRSVFFGLEGNYNLGKININFNNQQKGVDVFPNSAFGKLATRLLSNSTIKLASFGYLHVFIHEMGHALADRICGAPKAQINVYTQTCRGSTSCHTSNLFVTLAGPILGIIWEVAKLIAAIALIIFLPPPIGLPLGIFLGAGSVFWIFGESAYACSRNGDWSFLKR